MCLCVILAMLVKAQPIQEGHVETVLEVAVKRHLEHLREVEKQKRKNRRRTYQLWCLSALVGA